MRQPDSGTAMIDKPNNKHYGSGLKARNQSVIMPPMNKTTEEPTPEETRRKLLALMANLRGRSNALKGGLQNSGPSGAPMHLAEQASDSQEIETLAGRLTSSSESIGEINHAIERIEQGKFNVCEECENPVGSRRLKITPWATLCVECKRKAEEQS